MTDTAHLNPTSRPATAGPLAAGDLAGSDPTVAAQLARYREGAEAIRSALAGITDEELDRRPAPGAWSAREVVHHVADSEVQSAIRLRTLLVADDPVIVGYDEGEWAVRLGYAGRPIEAALALVAAVRAATAELAERLTLADLERAGTHTESGPYSVRDWLAIYADHCHSHAEQITEARAGRA